MEIIFAFIGVIFVLYAITVLTVWLFQRKILYHPVRLSATHRFDFEQPYQELSLPTSDGESQISALHFRTEIKPSIKPKVIFYCHGNADNLQRWGEHHAEFMARGYDFFVWDYRGFGKTKGKPTMQNIYTDASQCYQYLLQHYDSQDIVFYGRSLGTGIATMLAAKYKATLLILETPYDSIEGVFAAKAPFLYLPIRLKDNFSTTRYLSDIDCPICVMHGTKDEIIAYGRAERLKPFLKKEDLFIAFPNGKHKNLNTFALYHETLDLVFKKYEQKK